MGGRKIRMYRYAVSQTDVVRVIVITSLVVSCTLITAVSFPGPFGLINYQLFFIPVLYATFFYAWRGLIVAGISAIA
jgi:glucose-6-phosphate-specific signal transduction histidine kinase